MKKIRICFVLFFFTLFLVVPVFAQETSEEMVMPDEGAIFSEEMDEGVITGEIISLDMGSSVITLRTEDGGEMTFSVVEQETILWKGIDDIELSDIEKGQEAEVGYYSDGSGKLVASWVDVLVKEEAATALSPFLEQKIGDEEKASPEAASPNKI